MNATNAAAPAASPAGWQLSLPRYPAGCLDPTLYTCGHGLWEEGEESVMQLIDGTTGAEFDAYLAQLDAAGYVRTFENRIDRNRYAAYEAPDGAQYYLSYMQSAAEEEGRVRVILDRGSNITLREFCYTAGAGGESTFYMFNMNTPGEDTFLIHAADDTWIVIDGGVTGYGDMDPDERFSDALFDFMRARSRTPGPLVISAWYLTHAHRDHFLVFGALLRRHHTDVRLQRMLANIPGGYVPNSNLPDFRRCMETVRRYYPGVRYLKAHAGMEIRLADVRLTVLLSQEEQIDFWVRNREVYEQRWKDWKAMDRADADFRACRNGYKLYDFNNTSLICLIRVGELSVLELGDGYRAETWMVPYYSMATLRADILKVAHHFNNDELVDFYRSYTADGGPVWALVPNARYYSFCDCDAKRAWYQSLAAERGQHFLVGSYSTIYGFRKDRGALLTAEIPAAYSYGEQHPRSFPVVGIFFSRKSENAMSFGGKNSKKSKNAIFTPIIAIDFPSKIC